MTYLSRFGLFWYTFLVGDDWRGALVALAGFAGTYLLVRAGVTAFWFLPVFVLGSLTWSLRRRARQARNAR